MIGYVYILRSGKDNKKYIGSTANLNNRLNQHNSGQVKSTKFRRPLVLWGYQKFESIELASEYEKKFKRSHDLIKRMIKSGKFVLVEGAAQRALPGGE